MLEAGFRPIICSVISEKYIPFARTLCDSFLEHEPNGTCFILIVDGLSGKFDSTLEKFKVLTPNDLKVPQFDRLVQKYTAFELCCAMKPFLLRHLIEEGKLERVLYFDSDILVLSTLQSLFAELDESSVIVTPHLDADFPPDGRFPDDAAIMKAGVINGGFIGVRRTESGLGFLEWWSDKMKVHCINNQSEGYFVDQKYLEYASVLFPEFHVLHSTQYNVAYWNLHSRQVTKKSGSWFSNNKPICFYHFSGFDPEADFQISRHQNRINLTAIPEVEALCALYAEKLLENGYLESKNWPYGEANELNGENIEPDLRLILQKLYILQTANLSDNACIQNQLRPEISVVLALDNKTTNLSLVLGPILMQDCGAVEVIVVTRGAPVKLRKQFQLFDLWVKCIHMDENVKLSEAFNTGIKATNGPIVAWMTQIDCLAQGTLSRVTEHFNSDPSLDVIIGQNAFKPLIDYSADLGSSSFHGIGALLEEGFINGSGIFSRKNVLERHGALKDYHPLAMSHEYILSIAQYSKVRILEDVLTIPFSDSPSLDSDQHLTELEQIVEIYSKKHGHVPTQWLKSLSRERASSASNGIENVAKIGRMVIYLFWLLIYSLKYNRLNALGTRHKL